MWSVEQYAALGIQVSAWITPKRTNFGEGGNLDSFVEIVLKRADKNILASVLLILP